MPRPQTFAFVGVSLDGFLAKPDGSVDWLKPFEGQDHGYTSFFASVDTLIIGRRTYDFVCTLDAWPYAEKRCVVVTHRPVRGGRGERAHQGELAPLLEELHTEGARRVYVDGGQVIRACLAEGVLDELTVTVVPALIGAGLPLFGGVAMEKGLQLQSAESFSDGLVQLRYRVRAP